ncbi:MAG: ATP-binding cassette domain-containing protein [Syntrophaceae bacterium]|nr:ATP-binding cassette domain-containing protein [Syntrophaceae bacterium]
MTVEATPILEMTGFGYTYPGSKTPVLTDVNLTIQAGECVCLSGPSGSGKTTLLLAVQGLLNGQREGRLNIRGPSEQAIQVAMVFQNADTQILCTTVADEVTFGPENIGTPPAEIREVVFGALQDVGLLGFESRNVEALSAGEKHRLTIAAVLSMKPGLLLLDEPSAQLDEFSKEKLLRILVRLKQGGHTLAIADHDLTLYASIADRVLLVENGKISEVEACNPCTRPQLQTAGHSAESSSIRRCSRSVLSVENLSLCRSEGIPVFRDITCEVGQAEFVHLYGENGTGKSTFLRCLAGLVRPEAGTILLHGETLPSPGTLLGKIALLFQNPCRQLFEDTVFNEVAFSLKRMSIPPDRIRTDVLDILARFDLLALADRSPLTLSFGQQHRVALASVMAPRPGILLLDEPFSGLDFDQRERILTYLEKLRSDFGLTVILASHARYPDPPWADTQWTLREGILEVAS